VSAKAPTRERTRSLALAVLIVRASSAPVAIPILRAWTAPVSASRDTDPARVEGVRLSNKAPPAPAALAPLAPDRSRLECIEENSSTAEAPPAT